jgi:hypothetical protein
MTGKVRGRINDDRVTGTAETIEVENEVRGQAANVNAAAVPQTFTVNGQRVYVDANTVYGNLSPSTFAAIANGTYVEVHGLRDSTGAIRATRVEAQTQGANGLVDEIRGTVTAVGTNSFTLGSAPNAVTVTYTGATTFAPAGSNAGGLQVGTIVEVHGNFTAGTSTFAATKIDFEDSEDSSLAPSGTDSAEVEGYVSGFTAHPGSFLVNGRSVRTTSSTRFEDGSGGDLVNNVRVEVEGVVDAQGVLVASKVEFRNIRVQLHGRATAVDAVERTIVVLGQTVRSTNLTRIESRSSSGGSTSLADVVPNVDCVEVRATVEGSSIVAEEIKEPDSCGKELVQAAVSAKNETTFTLTFFGTLNASLASTPRFLDRNEQAISRAQFFAAVVPASATSPGTLVEVEGNSLGAVEKAELKD